MCNVVCILSDPKCTDVELIIFGDLLKKSSCVGPDAGVVPWSSNTELEVVNILQEKKFNYKTDP